MSDTETELERGIPSVAMKARQPHPSPATEPTVGAAKPEAVEQPPTQPGPLPTEPSPAAAVATHSRAAAESTPRRRRRPPQSSGFPWEVSPLAKFPMAELLSEIDRRHTRAKMLLAERKRILAKMADLEAEMGFVGQGSGAEAPAGRPAGEPRPRRQRARNGISLADALAMAVEPRATVTPAEAAQLVLSNGHQSTSKHFGMVVANALAKDARFVRRGRGKYERVELAALDAQLRDPPGENRPARLAATRHRPAKLALPRIHNSIRLPDAITLEAEVGEVVTPAEIAKRVLASGYQTSAARFETVVASAMSRHKAFRRVGRGQYERVSMSAAGSATSPS